MPSRCAWRMTSSHSSEFVFFGAMMSRTRSTRISPPPPGSESSPASRSRDSVSADGQLRPARDVLDLGRREAVQVDRVARLDRAEQILVAVDAEVGMVAALHEDAGAADRERLLDLLEDHRLRQQVALARVARAAVEGAEVADGGADVRVVDVAVDDEGDAVRVGRAGCASRSRRARLRRGRATAGAWPRRWSVIRSPSSALLEDRGDGRLRRRRSRRGLTIEPPSRAKRSSGTWSSSPTSRAISRNV